MKRFQKIISIMSFSVVFAVSSILTSSAFAAADIAAPITGSRRILTAVIVIGIALVLVIVMVLLGKKSKK